MKDPCQYNVIILPCNISGAVNINSNLNNTITDAIDFTILAFIIITLVTYVTLSPGLVIVQWLAIV